MTTKEGVSGVRRQFFPVENIMGKSDARKAVGEPFVHHFSSALRDVVPGDEETRASGRRSTTPARRRPISLPLMRKFINFRMIIKVY